MRTLSALMSVLALTACGPDLRVAEVIAPETACPGDDIGPLTSATVENLSDEDDAAGVFHVGWYLSDDAVFDPSDTLLVGGRDQVDGLIAGELLLVETDANQIPADAALGEQYLLVVVDELEDIDEANELNNVAASPITLTCDPVDPTAQIVAGGRQTCALSTAGAVRCWGSGEFGVLGYGNTDNIGDDERPATAGDVPLGAPATQLAAGYFHTCALLDTGNVRCWGRNDRGQLGYGNTDNIGDDETPDTVADVALGGRAIALTAGVSHTCALLDTGAIRCWGDGMFGQLGYGNTDPIGDDETPASAGDVPVGRLAVAIAAGEVQTCAVLDTGDVRCWGGELNGMLGTGSPVSFALGDDEAITSVPPVNVGGRVFDVTLGSGHTCALLDTGDVRCWGTADRLGYGGTSHIGDDEDPATAGDRSGGCPGGPDLGGRREHLCADCDGHGALLGVCGRQRPGVRKPVPPHHARRGPRSRRPGRRDRRRLRAHVRPLGGRRAVLGQPLRWAARVREPRPHRRQRDPGLGWLRERVVISAG